MDGGKTGMTVKQVSALTGVSIRTLQYYDSIGLLVPADRSAAGYRLYSEYQLADLQEILLFRELGFPLKDIKTILTSPRHDRKLALEQQIDLLKMEKAHLDDLIRLAEDLLTEKGDPMDFTAFDKAKLDEYAEQAKELYKDSDAYREFEEKQKTWQPGAEEAFAEEFMGLFREFGDLLRAEEKPDSPAAQAQVKKLQEYITGHFYRCTPEILAGLGQMYAAGGEFTENIDAAGGPGTAAFASAAIDHFCK